LRTWDSPLSTWSRPDGHQRDLGRRPYRPKCRMISRRRSSTSIAVGLSLGRVVKAAIVFLVACLAIWSWQLRVSSQGIRYSDGPDQTSSDDAIASASGAVISSGTEKTPCESRKLGWHRPFTWRAERRRSARPSTQRQAPMPVAADRNIASSREQRHSPTVRQSFRVRRGGRSSAEASPC